MAVGQTGEAPQAHAQAEIEPLDMACAYPVVIGTAEHWYLFAVYYSGRAVAGRLLGATVVLYQHGEVDLHSKGKGDIVAVVAEAVRGQLEFATADGAFQLEQECPARIPDAETFVLVNFFQPSRRNLARVLSPFRIKQPHSDKHTKYEQENYRGYIPPSKARQHERAGGGR